MTLVSRRPLVLFFALICWAVAMFVGVSAYYAWKFTGPQHRPVGPIPDMLPESTRPVEFEARDHVKLRGWFIPCSGATEAVVLLHGNGSTRLQMVARAALLHQHGYATLLYDARGHGESDGTRTSVGWYEVNDLLGALDYLRTQGFRSFGCIGASQGGATIALAAPRLRDVQWAILEGTYPTLRTAVDRRFRQDFKLPLRFAGLLFVPIAERRLGVDLDAISPVARIAELRCPVLIAGGTKDVDTPAADTEALFAAAREPKTLWLVPGAGHTDLYGYDPKAYEAHILKFIADAANAAPPRPKAEGTKSPYRELSFSRPVPRALSQAARG